jgi:hypothetical protein
LVYPPIIVKNNMKRITAVYLLILTIGIIGAADLESYQFIDHLLGLSRPGAPDIYEDVVIFTAPSSFKRVGVSFAHEGYTRIYWLRQLRVPEDPAIIAAMGKKKNIDPTKDSGMLFHIQTVPPEIRDLDYRMIIDGLWTTDPLNPQKAAGPSGLTLSRVHLPERKQQPSPFDAPPGSLQFTYNAPPGESVTVAGSFNGWDPFMYEMKEVRPGSYSLTLALPPGVYQYVFFHRGEQIPDPYNPSKVYTKNGRIASQAEVR